MVSVIKTTILFFPLLLWFPWLPTTTGQECAAGKWKCRNNTCVTIYARCDGEDDCDGSDEENCEKWRCPDGLWKCHNHRCILMTFRCDGKHDCSDGSDEQNCKHWMCPAHKWKCSNNRCVSTSSRCNGKDNCGDGSDETDCAPVSVVCPSFVMEGEDAKCLCKSGWQPTSLKGSWFTYSSDQHLTLTNVQRADNGSNYTCIVDSLGPAKAVYTLRVAYGPYKGHVSVGPSRFIANGSQTFTLTCNVADVYPTPYYTWHGIACNNQFPNKTCSFTPQPAADDLKNVTCTATSVTLKRAASKTVQLDFYYPPTEKPLIKPHEGELVRRGDNLTCTVEGGKPAVRSVHFHCLHPVLPDEEDEIKLTTVSSSVTVDLAEDNKELGMTCFCNATWETRPKWYQLSATSLFCFDYKVDVPSLTLNGSDKAAIVNGDDHVTLNVICRAVGCPRPNVTLAKATDSMAARDIQYKRTGPLSNDAMLTLSDVQCRDMGEYTCTADNGIGETDTSSIMLYVKCPPRNVSTVSWNVVERRLEFSLEAYPVPKTFVFIHYGNRSSDAVRVVPSEMFSTGCEQDPERKFMVKCHVMPLNVPKELLGTYRASLHNSLGYSEFTFTLLEEAGGETNDSGKATFAAVGCVLSISIIGIASVIIWKKRRGLPLLWRNIKRTHTTCRDRTSGLYAEIDEYPMNQHYHTTPQGSVPVGPPPSRPLPLPPAAGELTHPDGDILRTLSAVSVETGDKIADDSTDEMDPYNKLRERETCLDKDRMYSHTKMPTEETQDEDEVYNHLSQGRESAQDPELTYSHTDTAV